MRISWDEMFQKNVIEFLNVCSYVSDKAKLEAQQMKEYTKKNTRVYG